MYTLYSIGNTIESVKEALSNDFRIIQNWFHENFMILNAKKCHYMCFGIGSENEHFIFNGIKLPNSCEEKILGVITDNELKFDPHRIHIKFDPQYPHYETLKRKNLYLTQS